MHRKTLTTMVSRTMSTCVLGFTTPIKKMPMGMAWETRVTASLRDADPSAVCPYTIYDIQNPNAPTTQIQVSRRIQDVIVVV